MKPTAVHLEKITKFVSAHEKKPKAFQFALQSVAREILSDTRIKICYRYRVPNRDVEIWHSYERQSAYYCGLMKCGMGWVCPLCSARLSEQRRSMLKTALGNARDTYIAVMVTYTCQHDAKTTLKMLLDNMLEAYRTMRRGRPWRTLKDEFCIAGEVRAVEITHGDAGWHPHFHTMMFLDIEILKSIRLESGQYDMSLDLYAPLEAHLTPMWLGSLNAHGLSARSGPGLRVSGNYDQLDDYLTKSGTCTPKSPNGWGAEEELTKSNRKKSRGENLNVWDLLLYAFVCGGMYARWFREYYEATKGKSQMQWTPGMLERLKIAAKTNDEMTEQEPEPEDFLLTRLTAAQWYAVLEVGAEGRLLDECATGDIARFEAFMARIGAPILG